MGPRVEPVDQNSGIALPLPPKRAYLRTSELYAIQDVGSLCCVGNGRIDVDFALATVNLHELLGIFPLKTRECPNKVLSRRLTICA